MEYVLRLWISVKCQKFGILFFLLFQQRFKLFKVKISPEIKSGVCFSFITAKLLKMQLDLPDERKCKLRNMIVFFLQLKEE